ncbi:MAG: FISUMP domain-containing protein [Candidatus Saccharibacteria bacterium]|nr:FISUMP domain-containing protein [Candidatus Saccharibacteria bacterium]
MIVHKNKAKNETGGINWGCLMIGGMAMAILGAGGVMGSARVAAEPAVDEINVNIPVSCTMTGTGMDTHDATVHNDEYVPNIGTTTLKAFCNDVNGFAIYAIGFTGDAYTGENHTKLIGAEYGEAVATGTATSGNTSNWAMKLATDAQATYAVTLENGYGAYSVVPDTFTKVASRASGTDIGVSATGATLTTTYAAFMNATQVADTYTGKVKYVLVHPASETPLQPQPSTAGYINYYANASDAIGAMGRQEATDGNTVKLFASNFSRDGYGFAGWSDAFDYATNANAHFYGPNEDITVPTGTTANGLSLYAVWIKSAGDMQDTAKTASVCNGLTAATAGGTRTLASVSALTDTRDGQTYAIAKLADNKCWMIENLRLADTHQEGANTVPTTLTTANTNNPLNDGINVTLKHNYSDTETYTNLSATSSDATSWCKTDSAACDDQSRLRTDNTASRVSYTTTQTMSTNANLYSYGNYYNWYSATAGNGTYSKSSDNTAGDLCPTGWHLPTGNTTGEYYAMNTAVNGGSTSSDAGLRSYPNNFLHSGLVVGASLNYRGSNGNYWSSTAGNGNYAYGLYFSSSNVSPGTDSNSKFNGRSVRCLVSPGA